MKAFFVILSLLLFASYSFSRDKISKDIIHNKNILRSKKRSAKKIKNKLEDIASTIIAKKREISIINNNIRQSDIFLENQKKQYVKKMKELNFLQGNISLLSKTKDKIKKQIIQIISKELSIEIIGNYRNNISLKSIISQEIVNSLSKILRDKFDKIRQKYDNVNKKIDNVTKKIKDLKAYIKKVQNRKKVLAKNIAKRIKNIKYLKYQKVLYDRKLNRIFYEQNAIKKTLTKLNILKLRKRFKKPTRVKNSNINSQKIRKFGTSYQKGRVVRYRGRKTIAPLKSFYIKRKFGEYYDPIYKIRIFNESVVLGSKIPNAKVKNVLNGKVIFAKATPILDNVVIVENADGIHTIYAHLSKIAPTVKKGMKIRKGYVLGRIKNELTFEVTQKNNHINPLKLIRF